MTSFPSRFQKVASLDKTLRRLEETKKKVNQPETINTHTQAQPSFKVILGNKK